MKKYIVLIVMFFVFVFLPGGLSAGAKIEQSTFDMIDRLTNAHGEFTEKENVYKVNFPRSDIKVNVAGVNLPVSMGLASWAAFKIINDSAVVMGDTVLLEDQVNPVMDTMLENGLKVTALHNHFLWDKPRVMFMHFDGSSTTEKLAGAIGKMFKKITETSGGKGEKPFSTLDPSGSTLDPKKIEEIIGQKGEFKNGVYKVIIGRTTKMNDDEMGETMGVNTWAAFAGSDDKAVVDGDFVMLEQEVQDVLKALRNAKINIVSIHNHMLMEDPRMIFLHFWGAGPAGDLSKGLKAALDTQKN
ncbi:MAG: DUF1259 domain-containing protein [bacterium]|nr:DUF1259 domain-containing protein [bacterium]